MILEKALVQYNKKNEYEYTIQSDYIEFKSKKELNNYIKENIKKDIEFYIYKNKEDLNNNNHIDVVICNDIIK